MEKEIYLGVTMLKRNQIASKTSGRCRNRHLLHNGGIFRLLLVAQERPKRKRAEANDFIGIMNEGGVNINIKGSEGVKGIQKVCQGVKNGQK